MSVCLFLGQPSRRFLWPGCSHSPLCVCHTSALRFLSCRCGTQPSSKSHELCRLRALTANICSSRLQGEPFREGGRVPQLSLSLSGLCRQLFYTNCLKIAAIKVRFGSLHPHPSCGSGNAQGYSFLLFIAVCFLFSKAYYIGCKQQQKMP